VERGASPGCSISLYPFFAVLVFSSESRLWQGRNVVVVVVGIRLGLTSDKPLSAEEKDKYLRIPNAPGEEFFGGHAHITMKGVEELVRAELERAPISRVQLC
jgi:hypothetical protein